MSKNLHENPFDHTTIAKLEIFEDYAKAWIPTFVMYGEPVICIFDFFAGTGYDKNGVPGSPIRILDKIREQIDLITQRKIKVKVFLNEFDKSKCKKLAVACDAYFTRYPELRHLVDMQISEEDFDICFFSLLPEIQKHSSLVYLDQNGIRFSADRYLLELEKTVRTDFLYFISSSYFWRFGNLDEFKMYVSLDMDEIKKNPYRFIHRSLITELRKRLPPDSKLKLYPFSLKKGANIHGIIFGASHPRAVEKFLTVAWKRNETNGEANFDIDEDRTKDQLDLFEGKRLTKIETFQLKLRELVLAQRITNNSEAFNFALNEAHLGSHAAEELKRMKKAGLISFDGPSPLVTYENVYKNSRLLSYKIL
ncbi:MAG: three-Cys-motif partner protein TcmP [Saprospiraceae bacterium]